jgi:small-conductance mechanosensitive channel
MPTWGAELVWTTVIVAAAYAAGHLLNAVIGSRLAGLMTARSPESWEHALIAEIRRRIPFWSLLVGIYLSIPHWHLNLDASVLAARIVSALGVASVTIALSSVATRLVVAYGPRAAPAVPVSGLTQNIVRIVVIILGLLVIAGSFGYDIRPMLTALGVGGLAVALAVQEPLSNLFAGLFVALAGQIRIGDYIRLDSGAEGYVIDFNWRSARLRQLSDNIVVVPNSKLAQAIVTNYSLPGTELGIGVDLTVDWSSDLDRVERIARAAASDVVKEVTGTIPAAIPSVRFQSFTDTGIRVSIGLRVRGFADQFLVKHELVKRLHAALAREGIGKPPGASPIVVPEQGNRVS